MSNEVPDLPLLLREAASQLIRKDVSQSPLGIPVFPAEATWS